MAHQDLIGEQPQVQEGVRLPFLVSRIVAEYLVPAFQGQGSKAEAGLHCLLSATSVSHPHKFKIMDGYPGDKAFH